MLTYKIKRIIFALILSVSVHLALFLCFLDDSIFVSNDQDVSVSIKVDLLSKASNSSIEDNKSAHQITDDLSQFKILPENSGVMKKSIESVVKSDLNKDDIELTGIRNRWVARSVLHRRAGRRLDRADYFRKAHGGSSSHRAGVSSSRVISGDDRLVGWKMGALPRPLPRSRHAVSEDVGGIEAGRPKQSTRGCPHRSIARAGQ